MRLNLLSGTETYRAILTNSVSLVGTNIVTSGFGFLYWWLAARQFPTEAVGLGSAAISAMLFLGNLSVLGFGTLLVGELPRKPGEEGSLISMALLVVGTVGAGLGLIFAIAAPWVSTELRILAENIGNISLFTAGVCLTAVTLVLDQAMVGLLRSDLQLWRNAIFSITKLVALIIAGLWVKQKLGLTIYATWQVGIFLSVMALFGYGAWKNGKSSALRPKWGLLPKLGSAALGHHVLNLALQAPGLIMPIVVTAVLSTEMNAYFYTSWMIASFATVISLSLTTVLYAVGSADPGALASKVRLTLRLSLLAGFLTSVALLVGANLVLGLFKPAYAGQAGLCLRILGLTVFPLIAKNHFIVIRRIRKQIVSTALWMLAGGVLELTLAAIGARLGGLAGLSLGWVAAMCIEALFMVRTIYHVAFPASVSNSLPTVPSSTSS